MKQVDLRTVDYGLDLLLLVVRGGLQGYLQPFKPPPRYLLLNRETCKVDYQGPNLN